MEVRTESTFISPILQCKMGFLTDFDLEAAWTLMKMANSQLDELKTSSTLKIRKAPQTFKPKTNNVKRPRKQKHKEINLTSTPDMPAAMRERIAEMGGYEIELVIQKQLYDTDLNKNHGRLSLPFNKLRFNFVTEEEATLLDRIDGNKKKQGMNVMIIDPDLRESVICLKKWKIGSNNVYCLMTHWNSFVQQNGLKSGEVVQIWSFRKDGVDVANQTENLHHLCFAMATPNIHQFQ